MSVVIFVGLIVLGLALLVAGGEALLRGAVGLAVLFRLTPAVIGLTVVAIGTSIPELAVSAFAAYQGNNDIAVANAVGSSTFNITVILGLCAAFRPLSIVGNTFKLEYPVLVLVTLLCLVMAQDGLINRLDATLCIAVQVGFTAYLVNLVREQVTATETLELGAEVEELVPPDHQPRFWVCLGLVAVGIVLLSAGARVTISGAVGIARILGWSERFIGLTIVSAGTGLPEVVASVLSTFRGRNDIAIGNVIGSNLFNILGVLGITAMITPLPVTDAIFQFDCWWLLGVTLLLFPLMWTGSRLNRWEGLILLTVYGVYIGMLLESQA